ncbi:glycosyltransferase [Mariprofundus ferrooxydans]|uniref:glycosyltransferase n=1 Tax=Mariprofundus ferrooxydans TaxID=314344 RepID=UPI0014313DDB|nr:glycosyltransferase [Mariprofundus ferrooxydans]
MTLNPLVSIVIPVYNGSDFLAEAIDSALAQTYKNIEVIVVNDGSVDDGKTEKVALSYGSRIRYYYKQNGGVASALNRAIVEMTGEYFSWLSHDDLYTPDKVEKELTILNEYDEESVVVYSDYALFTDDPAVCHPVRLDGIRPEHFRYWITVENRLNGCTLLIPRKAFGIVGVFNEQLRTTQDYDLWFRMAQRFDFIHLSEVLIKSRQHGEQGSVALKDVAWKECDQLLAGFVSDLSREEITVATHKTLSQSYLEIADSFEQRKFRDATCRAVCLSVQSVFVPKVMDTLNNVCALLSAGQWSNLLQALRCKSFRRSRSRNGQIV